MQSESEELYPLGAVSEVETSLSVAATKALFAIRANEVRCCAVNQILKSVVREIRTLRSVGAGVTNRGPFYPVGAVVRPPPIPIILNKSHCIRLYSL